MKLQKFGAKSATADSCFGLIGPRQCSAALGGPAVCSCTFGRISNSYITCTWDAWHILLLIPHAL